MSAPHPLVSVVVPAYNAERTLPTALRSIVNQTFDDFDVIVVDDGSADSTAETAASFGDERIRVLPQANAGHAAARNAGIAAATGVYVGFLDADDLWLPEKLQRQVEWFRANEGRRALQTGAFRVDDDLNVLWERRCVSSDDPLLDALCFRNMPGLMSTLLIERAALVEIGGFDPSLRILQDWDLAIRLAVGGMGLSSLADPLAAYRVHAGNQSSDVEIHLDPGLRVLDKVFANPSLPRRIRNHRRQVYGCFYTMLCGGEFKARRWRRTGYWAARAVVSDPRALAYMLAMPLRRSHRVRSSRATRELNLAFVGSAPIDSNQGRKA